MNSHSVSENELRRPSTPLNADLLKTLAMIIMLIDHIGAFLMDPGDPYYRTLRIIGRLAFPIFCFLMAEGAHFTRSMPKYLGRLAAFALISTPPYNLVHGSPWYSCENINVFFTLFLGLAAVCSVSRLPREVFRKLGRPGLADSRAACLLAGLPLCLLCYMTAYWLDTDYGEYGVAAILLFWLLRKRPVAAWIGFSALTVFFFGFFIAVSDAYGVTSYSYVNLYNLVTEFSMKPRSELYFFPQIQLYAPLACIPCLLYNGQKGGKHSRIVQYLFYAFYPVHLWCLWLIQLFAGIQ